MIGKAPRGRWRTLTFLAAQRGDRIDAPCLFEGPINGQKFLAYAELFLVPMLHASNIVVLDNPAATKLRLCDTLSAATIAKLLFLPPYSPDLDPIEQAFAKLKHWLQKAQTRSIEETYRSIASILERFKPNECAAYLANSGYAST